MPGGSSSSRSDSTTRRRGSFLARLPARLAAHWRLKAALAVAIGILFTTAYLLIGHFPIAIGRYLTLTWIDRAIGFHPHAWVWIYQSVYVPMNVIPWLAERRGDVWRYVDGFALVTIVSFAVFIVWPIHAPKPQVEDPLGMYWLLQQYDAPYNSLPSLHAALLVYTLAFGRRILGDEAPRGLKSICVAWAGLILYATLATKEHYAVDIVAGIALGLAAHRWAWRGRRRGGLGQDAQHQRADIPRGIEVVVGPADGVQLSRQVDEVPEKDASTIVRTHRG